MSQLLKPYIPLKFAVRTYIKNYKWKNEGIRYPGFTYYPRYPDHKDPPYEPTKLFMVQRIKPVKGNPYWEKEILKALQLDGKAGEISIVKNIPDVNALLWKIKHLIKITPITFPNGMPTENDLGSTFLKENGEFMVVKQIKPSSDVLEATEKYVNDPKKLDGNTLRRQSRLKWLHAWDTSL